MNFLRLMGVVSLALVMQFAGAVPPARVVERWLTVEISGKHVGYTLYRVNPPQNGVSHRYEHSLMKTKLLGQDLDLDVVSDSWVDRDGGLLEGKFDMESAGRITHVEAKKVGNSFHIISDASGQKSEENLAIPKDAFVADDPAVDLFTHEPTKKDFFVLAPQNLSLVPNKIVSVARSGTDPRGTSTVVQVDDVRSPTTYYLSSTSEVILARGPFGIEMRPATQAEATAAIGDRGDLADISKIEVSNPPVSFADYHTAHWKIEGCKIRLESDENQSVQSEGADQLIDTHPVTNVNQSSVIGKIQVPDLKWLTAEPRVSSDDKSLQTVAKSAIGDEKRIYAASQKLRELVHQSIGVNAGIGVLRDAREVWASKEGVCRDHAVLLLTLLRSVGIPSKMVCGLVYDSGALYYHAWVEAFDGERWYGLDSTREAPLVTCDHIKTSEGARLGGLYWVLTPRSEGRFSGRSIVVRMKINFSLAVTVLGALLGASLCAAEMPSLLDWIYQSVTVSSLKPTKPPEVDTADHADAVDPGAGAMSSVSPTPVKVPHSRKQDALVSNASQPVRPPTRYEQGRSPIALGSMALLGLVLGGALGSLLASLLDRLAKAWDRTSLGDRVTLFLGCIAGIIVSIPLISILQGLLGAYVAWVFIPMVVALSGTSIYMLRSMEQALPWYAHSGTRKKSGIKILDTNVLIDGRIQEVIRCGFLEGDLYVPEFVIKELQYIADSADSQRRTRGRRGLDVLKRIQAEHTIDVGSQDRFANDPKEEVDSRLVKLAKAIGADLVSNDFNLNKVATIQEVRVLNLNDLVTSLRPTILPGEKLSILVTKEGTQPKQGVGYLDDGTMVVIEHGAIYVGQEIDVDVTQVIQTERGKMMFADAGGSDETDPGAMKRRVNRTS